MELLLFGWSLGIAAAIANYLFNVKPKIKSIAAELRNIRREMEPVPLSERLPGPEDCDADGQCWLWRTDGIEEFWELVIPSYNIHEYNWTSQWKYTHWLPAHALPVPQQESRQ